MAENEQGAPQAAAKAARESAAGAAPNGDPQDAASEIARLKAELEEIGDRTLRAQAELENYRKRARRELEDERRYANVPLLRDLLPVLDNIQRAISAAEKNSEKKADGTQPQAAAKDTSEKKPEASVLLEGIRMVAQSLEATLARHHCRRIEAQGKPFDPAFHEAIAQQPSADHPAHTVLAVAQDGFMVHERVVRPAQVVVST